MAFNLKTSIASIAPTLAAMLGGPLAGAAVTALEGALGLSPGAGADGITQVLQSGSLTPENIAAIRAADQKHAEILAQQGIDLAKINADHDNATDADTIADVVSARATMAGKDQIWSVAYVILASFAFAMAGILYGCWSLITGGIKLADGSVIAAVSGLVGAITGYFSANAQVVVNFLFGGSLGSRKSSAALADSTAQSIKVLGDQQSATVAAVSAASAAGVAAGTQSAQSAQAAAPTNGGK